MKKLLILLLFIQACSSSPEIEYTHYAQYKVYYSSSYVKTINIINNDRIELRSHKGSNYIWLENKGRYIHTSAPIEEVYNYKKLKE